MYLRNFDFIFKYFIFLIKLVFINWVYNFSTVMLHCQLFVYNNRKKENRKKNKKTF